MCKQHHRLGLFWRKFGYAGPDYCASHASPRARRNSAPQHARPHYSVHASPHAVMRDLPSGRDHRLDLLLGLENRIVYTAQEVLAESCRLEQALVKHKQEPNLALLPAGNPRMLEWLTPKDMRAITALLEPSFDYILIDCPAGIEDGFKNASAAAREAVVVTTPEVAAVRDADRVIGLLNSQGVSPIQLVLNRVRPKMMSNQEMLSADDVTDILALPLLGLVFEDEQVIVSTNRGEPLTLTKSNSPAAKAFQNIARRLQGEDVPLMDPSEARSGLRAKMRQLMQTRIF